MTDAFRLIQSGLVVARTEGPHAHALREIMMEANVHQPCTVQRRYGKRWKEYGRVGYAG